MHSKRRYKICTCSVILGELESFWNYKGFNKNFRCNLIKLMRKWTELTIWQKSSFFTKKQLQSLLGKLSFVTACVKPGKLFMARLLNSLRECKHAASYRYPISATMLLDIQWWLEFLPRYRRISLIKPFLWDFESLNFSTDACLQGGGATCQTECISFVFPDCISMSSLHINALELFTIVVALKHWARTLGPSVTRSQIHRSMR